MNRHGKVQSCLLTRVQHPVFRIGLEGIVENIRDIPQFVIVIHIHLGDEFFRKIESKAKAVKVIG